MRFIGGKSLLLEHIGQVVDDHMPHGAESVTDVFAGSGAVSNYFKTRGMSVVSNDMLRFSYAISRGTLALDSIPDFSRLDCGDPIDFLNNLDADRAGVQDDACFIMNHYAPNAHCERMYFQPGNAKKIDVVRIVVERWYREGRIDEDGYYYLLASLLLAVPYVANITGTFGAYLKYWDKRTFNGLVLRHPDIVPGARCRCLNVDYKQALGEGTELLYADPPYNSREYLPNYHVLETIARYDYPTVRGVTGLRDYHDEKSDFCKKARVEAAFETLVRDTASPYVLISYNNEGLVSTGRLSEICQDYAVRGSFSLTQIPYRRYKNKIPNNKAGLREQLYFFRRR